jgi:hypothetical protein
MAILGRLLGGKRLPRRLLGGKRVPRRLLLDGNNDNVTFDFGWSHSLVRGFHSPQKLQSAVSFLRRVAWCQLT